MCSSLVTSYKSLAIVPTHLKSMQPFFREAQDEVKGRKALATRAIRRGSRVLSTPAFAAVSVSACNWCMAAGHTFSRCGGCRQVRYCSRRCQQQDWTAGGHSMECVSWRQIPADADVSQSVLLAARLTARIHMIPAPEPDCDVLALRHHHDDHTPAKLAQFADVAQLVALLLQRSKYNADKLGLPALRSHLQHKIVQLLCRMNCNAFTICDDACAPVGLGVFPQGALFNHSCKPNCVVSFHGRQMNVHAIADIAQNEELLVSYVDVLASSSTRQRELRESYFFSCRCDRCSEDTALEDAYLDGYVCPDASCTQTKGGVLVLDSQGDSECRICGAKRSTSELQRLELEYAELSARQSSDVVAQWQLYRRCWQLLAVDMRVHPRSTRVAALARAMGNFLLNEPSLDDGEFTARLCFQRELEAMQWILPELPLPARGLLHYALGKWIHEHQQKKATEHLRQALIVLSCAYGRENALVGTIQTLLDDIQRGD